jgi:pilus assembly protein CpaE
MHKIIITDELSQSLKSLLMIEKLGEVFAEAENGKEVLRFIPTLKPDIILMDMDMPEMNGIEATQE